MIYGKSIYEVQEERSVYFPSDRIAFLRKNDYVARLDKIVFEEFRNKEITITEACRRVAQNNNLKEVKPEAFMNEFKSLGYARKDKEDEKE